MLRTDPCYAKYVRILEEELRPAMGCTEPIAVAYAAAKARAVLGALPERILAEVSGTILTTVKSWSRDSWWKAISRMATSLSGEACTGRA